MTEIVNHVLAAALVAGVLGFLITEACAERRAQAELINRPPNPFVCLDKSDRRWSICDREDLSD